MDRWRSAYASGGGVALRELLADVEVGEDATHGPLSDDEIRTLVPGVVVQSYPDFAKRASIEAITPAGRGVILYLTEDASTGHWVGLLRNGAGNGAGRTAEYMDPLGYPPDRPLKWITAAKRGSLNETHPEMQIAFQRAAQAGYRKIVNTHDFQKRTPNEATCGRHVACRLCCDDMSLAQYAAMIASTGMDADTFVTKATDMALHG